TNTGAASIDFTQANAITAVSLPLTGQATGTVTSIEDFTGVITASSSSSITVTSKSRGTLTGALTSGATGTTYTGLRSVNNHVCHGSAASVACIANGKTVSVDATVSSAGKVTITEVDFIDDPAVDEIEGVIYRTTDPNKFGMIVSDAVNATGNSSLTNVGAG